MRSGGSYGIDTKVRSERVVLVGVVVGREPPPDGEDPLDELADLVTSANGRVVARMTQKRPRPDGRTYIGKGKIEELRDLAASESADLIVTDDDLTPAQIRNLEEALQRRVMDRSELILRLFAVRARTREARDQVELAQLEYLRPRLRRMWTHLSRHDGSIGAQGPGEKQLEVDRRLADRRIRDLRSRIGQIQERRRREVASRAGIPSVSIIGYTNAGKTTLWNLLTGADGLVMDLPFATLDTRTRRWTPRPGCTVLLSDTVGFIRKLPHRLVVSFQATLEETLHAGLLLQVVDASSPRIGEDLRAVEEVLTELKCQDHPRWLVLNKIDRVQDRTGLSVARAQNRPALEISARTGEGIDGLRDEVAGWAAGLVAAPSGRAR